jgi:hypothetical protein
VIDSNSCFCGVRISGLASFFSFLFMSFFLFVNKFYLAQIMLV